MRSLDMAWITQQIGLHVNEMVGEFAKFVNLT